MSEYGADEVVILSTAFSLISIIVAVVTVITQKLIMQNQSFVVIGFDVKEQCIRQRMARRMNGIKKDISVILGAHKRAINIEPGLYLSTGGFHLEVQVDVNENEEPDYKQTMQKAIDSGAVAEMFRIRWGLQNVPIISRLTCTQMATDIELNPDIKMLISSSQNHEKVSSQSMSKLN